MTRFDAGWPRALIGFLSQFPDRCKLCGFHEPTQGHRDGCPEGNPMTDTDLTPHCRFFCECPSHDVTDLIEGGVQVGWDAVQEVLL